MDISMPGRSTAGTRSMKNHVNTAIRVVLQ